MNDSPRIISLPKVHDPRGNLTFIEGESHIPFLISRAYWIYDVPGGEIRGGHAFKSQKEFIIALSGSFDVIVRDKIQETVFHLNRSYFGLFLPNGYWRYLSNFSTNAVALVLSSGKFSDSEYLRDFQEFLDYAL